MHNEVYSIRYLFDWIKWITKKGSDSDESDPLNGVTCYVVLNKPSLKSFFTFFSSTDANRFFDWKNEDFSVTDFTGLRCSNN